VAARALASKRFNRCVTPFCEALRKAQVENGSPVLPDGVMSSVGSWDTPIDQDADDAEVAKAIGSGLVIEQGLTVDSYATHRLVMKWSGTPKTVLIVGKLHDQGALKALQAIAAWLMERGVTVVLEPQLLRHEPHLEAELRGVRTFSASDRLERSVDLMVTIGGDGTLTWAASLFPGPMPPILSFAAGSLGFLTPFASDRWPRTLGRIFDQSGETVTIPLVCRMRLNVVVHRRSGNSITSIKRDGIEVQCLNEILVHRGNSTALTKLEVGVDGQRVTLVQGDGLILATPTGSTAYSLAAGGSMVHPSLPAILLTPVSPHSLSFRPALLPDSAVITCKVPLSARRGASLHIDGKAICQLRVGDSIEISMSPHPVPTICHTNDTQDWFTKVNQALHWNGRVEQT